MCPPVSPSRLRQVSGLVTIEKYSEELWLVLVSTLVSTTLSLSQNSLRSSVERFLSLGAGKNGALFVAGNAQMATDVTTLLHELFVSHAGLDAKQAANAVRKLERERRFAVEGYG